MREQTNDGKELVDYLLAVARGTATIVHRLKKDDAEVERQQVPDFKERTDAAKLLLAYGFGTPTQYVEHSGEGGGPLQVAINIVRRVRE